TGDGIPIASGEHYGRRRTKALNAIEAERRRLSPSRLVDPLAEAPGDTVIGSRRQRAAANTRSVARSVECDAGTFYRADKASQPLSFFQELQCTANRIRTAPLWGLH